jgi:HEAT repeat protein
VYRVSVEATAVLTALQHKRASIAARFRFLNARISAESEMGAMIDTDRLQLELSRDTFCEIDEEGRIKSLLFDPVACAATASFARTLLGLMQFERPESAGPEGWEIDEDDASGEYRAQYDSIVPETSSLAEQEQSGRRAFRKTKVEYFTTASDETRELLQAPRTILPEGAFEVTFDFGKGRIEAISGSEKQTILIANRIVGGVQNRFQLKLSSEDKVARVELASAVDDQAARSSAVEATALSAAPSERAQLTAIHEAKLGNDSFETIKTALDAIEHGSSKSSYSEVYSKVKALIYLHPDVCAQLGTLLQSSDSGGPVAQLIGGALAAVGNAEAQDALINAMRTRRDDAATIQLLIALAAVKRPTLIAQYAVEELAWQSPGSSVGRAAQLTVGSMAHNLKQISPERAASIVEHATTRLSGVSGAETQLIALLGNAGAREALPVLERFLDHPSAEIRSRTALALRFIDAQQADEMLSKTLLSDADESVRIQAATALEFRTVTQTNFDAQRAALLSDKSDILRMRVMRNLWSSRESFPEVVSLVKRLASRDSSQDVRGSAARLLSGS